MKYQYEIHIDRKFLFNHPIYNFIGIFYLLGFWEKYRKYFNRYGYNCRIRLELDRPLEVVFWGMKAPITKELWPRLSGAVAVWFTILVSMHFKKLYLI